MSLRLYVDAPLQAGATLDLPPGPARHVQVRRAQPGDALVLFDGRGGEWAADVLRIGRQQVSVRVGAHDPVDRECPLQLALAVGMPANERMDWLVEKATELGVAAIQPLMTERSVLRLAGERAGRKLAHWQAVAVAAAEQSGRTRVPTLAPVLDLGAWLATRAAADGDAGPAWVLSLAQGARTRPEPGPQPRAGPMCLLSGPEGGLTAAEEARARAQGFVPWSLGPRVLRADTAPIAALAQLQAWTAAAGP